MDFFTLPTASLRVLYGWFVIHHQRRKVLRFSATFNPSAISGIRNYYHRRAA